MDLQGYLRAIRNSWWVVVVATLVGALAAVGYVAHATPLYSAGVTFYVSTPQIDSSAPLSADQYSQDKAITYASLLSSGQLSTLVAAAPGVGISAGQVAGEISGSAQLNTALVTATIQDTSTRRALAMGQAIARQFPTMVANLDKTAAGSPPVQLKVTSQPGVDPTPVSPRKTIDVALGIFAGLLIGLLLAVMRELLDTAVRSAEALAEVTDAPLLAEIAFDQAARDRPLIVDEAGDHRRSEEFRQLRTNVRFLDAAHPLKVVVVTSSIEGEGKSTAAANLAIVSAESGVRVLLVEADLRRPSVSRYLGLDGSSGLSNVLARHAELADVVQPWGSGGLVVLSSGPLPPNPSELLGSARMNDLIDAARASYDLVVIDSPPLLPVTDAAIMATRADGVIVVVRHGRTKRRQITTALRSLEAVRARVLGVVLSMRPRRGMDATYGGSSYYNSAADVAGGNPAFVVGTDAGIAAAEASHGVTHGADIAAVGPVGLDTGGEHHAHAAHDEPPPPPAALRPVAGHTSGSAARMRARARSRRTG